MNRILLLILVTFSIHQIKAQKTENLSNLISLNIDKNVLNANDKNEKEIIKVWTDYLNAGEFKNPNTKYWDQSEYTYPDYFLWPMNLKQLKNRVPNLQFTLIGIFPVENNHYAIKTSISSIDKKGEIVLEAIISVYAKKINGNYLLVSSSQYHKNVWKKVSVGKINYYVHPNHKFNREEAEKMNSFNIKMSKLFSIPPISFDYFVSNYSREIVQLWGYDYMPKIYIPGQTGGVADINNALVYAGNNSEYYPHELVHLYTFKMYPDGYHFWLNEGFATYIGGSGGKSLDWHIEKFREYVHQNPNFEISFKTLKGYIPNGLHSTEFRYVIGGIICKKVFEAKGMDALFEGLKNVRTDEQLYQFIEENLNVKKEGFSEYVKQILK